MALFQKHVVDTRLPCVLAFALLLFGDVSNGKRLVADERSDFFERKIRPVLVEKCYECHSAAGDAEGGLVLDSPSGMLDGGDSGDAVVPNDAAKSLLMSAIRYQDLEMPPDEKLSEAVIQDFETWIAEGAFDPRTEPEIASETVEEAAIDFAAARKKWPYKHPRLRSPKATKWDGWAQTRADRFIAAEWESRGLEPSSPASAVSLVRRLSYDLLGLPPSRDTVLPTDETLGQDRVEEVVDALMSSPEFGVHWARLWLDVMRFADDQAHIVGNNTALCYPNAYLYRDWVVDAFNSDMPYDEFLRLQLAADLLTPDDASDDVALGFVGLGPKYYRRNSPEVQADEWEDRIDVLSRGILGLTVACARCHDHKFDPISTQDYYALAGVFSSIEMFNRPLNESAEPGKNGNTKKPEDALHIIRDKKPRDLKVMVRGNVNRLGPTVPRGYLTVLSSGNKESTEEPVRTELHDGAGRLELANLLADRQNPLTARVFVNRVWGRLVGQPIVTTPSNFGALGAEPSHPELLDDLTVRFMNNGWSLKWLCREIVTSRFYQQQSATEASDADPENRWLARMNAKRLHVEQWRDGLLAAADKWQPSLDDEHLDPSEPKPGRRTLYSDVSRLKLNPMLALFDFPDPNAHSAGRSQTISASQKLFLQNSPFMNYLAESIAGQLDGYPARSAVHELYHRILSRPATEAELALGLAFLEAGHPMQEYVHAIMMTNEVFVLD
ncbi:MAG: PSD1 and planctomycete cytochrome C domain-containing protein [Aureliella sp.]